MEPDILQELEDLYQIDQSPLIRRACDSLALEREISDKLFRTLKSIVEEKENIDDILEEAIQCYEMLATYMRPAIY